MYPVHQVERCWMKRSGEAVSFHSVLLCSDVWLFLFCVVVRKYTENKLSLEIQSVVSHVQLSSAFIW